MTDDLVAEYAAVICHGDSVPGQKPCGQVKISEVEYIRQMDRPDSLWMCPHCGSSADFDDEYFERAHGIDQDDGDELYQVVKSLVRTHGTNAVREVLTCIEGESRDQ